MQSTSRTSIRLVALMAVQIRDAVRQRRDERGDVPGWVMITVMTVGIVVGLQLFVGPELESMMRQALGRVSN